MKLSKTNKLLLFFAIFVISLAVSFSFIGLTNANAEGEPATPATYEVSSKSFKVDGNTITIAKGVQYKKSDLVIKKTVGENVEPVSFDTLGLTPTLKNDVNFAYETLTTQTFILGGTTYTLTVVEDTNAPEYKKDVSEQIIFESAKTALENKLKENVLDEKAKYFDDNGIEQKCYKPIGSNKYVTIPSLKEYISDDTASYENMKYKVYYKVNGIETTYTSSSTVSSSFQIPVKEAGRYTFYVTFIDSLGNEMEIADTDKEKLTLSFEIFDNYPVKVEIGANHSSSETAYLNGVYKGTSYLFKFTGVDSSKTKYTLSYSEDNSEDSFVELTEDEKKAVEFKTSDLSFKPSKEGYYKITCEAQNESGLASDTNEVVIKVSEKPAETETQDDATTFWDWVSDHLLSVVFFCIAFVCLIAIIVLLCIKPKDETTSKDNK